MNSCTIIALLQCIVNAQRINIYHKIALDAITSIIMAQGPSEEGNGSDKNTKYSPCGIFLGKAGTGMTGPQEDSNEGKLCLPLKMGVVKGRVRMKMRWRVEGVG